MDLFAIDPGFNLLPHDGEVNYFGPIIESVLAQKYYQSLLNTIPWQPDEAVIMGKRIITKRKIAWYGDESYAYTYSRTTKTALPWTAELLELKKLVEEKSGQQFNSCLLNLYHNGDEGMAWHSDDEKSLGENTSIASLSLGAERKFAFKHKENKKTISMFLPTGSLLLMQGSTQKNWLHRLPLTKKVETPRINLTFRTMIV